jgi:hypothetical protein
MDFFSGKELVTQTGHEMGEWPQVIVKELVDNSLDACEEADVAPLIEVAADASGITVQDNGSGLPEGTLQGAMDFTVRASNREAYVSPCRGAQGNALKTLLPMPRVLDPEAGRLIVVACGKRHVIQCSADPISGRAVVNDDVSLEPTTGTLVRLEWGAKSDAIWPFDGCKADDHYSGLRSLLEGFAVFNPHATIRLEWFGKKTRWEATNPAWEKWKPHQPPSAHWYEPRHLERLLGAYITHERGVGEDRLVSDFLRDFDGLSGSLKRSRVLDDAGLRRVRLSEFVVNGRLDSERIARLLTAMQKHTRPTNPKRLGIIGEDHFRRRLLDMGIEPKSFRYSKKLSPAKSKNLQTDADGKSMLSGVPGVLESAFGWLGEGAASCRKIYAGANWSAAIKNPFRSFGSTGEGLETALSNMRATRQEPVVFVLHLAQPRVEYTDRGKSALVIGGAE